MQIKKSSLRLNRKTSTAFWLTCAVMLSWWFFTGQSSRDIKIYSYEAPEKAQWITSHDPAPHTACFRKDLELLSEVRHAHLSITAQGGFELIVNGNPVGAQTLWRPTRHFQNGLTESGQRLSEVEPIINYNFPREHQWAGHQNEKVLIHFDLSPYLKGGENSICIETEARKPLPAVIAFGSVTLKNGANISLQTDTSWAAEPVPKGLRQADWPLPENSVLTWNRAVISNEVSRRKFISSVPPSLYESPKKNRWVIADKSKKETGQTFRAPFSLEEKNLNSSAWLSLVSHSNYWIWVNNKRLGVNRSKKRGYNGGEWQISWEGRRPLAALPVLLDPDETGDFFGGYRYKDPRHGDPTENDFKRFENTLNRTRERPNQTGADLLDDRPEPGEPKGRLQDPYGFYEEPQAALPHTLLRQQASAEHHGYDISELLHAGDNEIRVRLIDDRAGRSDTYSGSQPLKFALFGQVGSTNLNQLEWQDLDQQPLKTAIRGKALAPDELPPLRYKGGVSKTIPKLFWGAIPLSFLGLLILSNLWQAFSRFRNPALIFSLTLLLGLLLRLCFQERSEIIFTHQKLWHYGWIILATFLALTQSLMPTLKLKKLKKKGTFITLGFLLLLTFILRAWEVHYQPIDDDEYASIQAVLSIAETGKPTIAQDIWYSRSPAYHYICAIFVKIFGPNIWALRLYSVLLAVMTGALLWQMTRYYFKNTWTAHAALLIFALHPFLIFSGHIARFYQQQQFFVLLMLHLFIMGFLHQPTIWRRAGAIFVFTLAVLSQEISISFVPVFFLLYLLFGRGTPFKWELKAVLYIILAGLLIVADVALFQIKCLTRTVGVSPNVEATLAPTFWELGNLFSMFIGYSRLHLALSAFYTMSLIYSIRRRSSLFLTLHITLLIAVVSFNFIITSVSFRYMYAIIPFWILLGAHGLHIFAKWISAHLDGYHPKKRTVSLMHWVALAVVILSFSPWRILESYDKKLLGDPISALNYVKFNLRPEDKVMITEPHPHAAKIELGRVDYDLVVPILYDFTYNDLSTGGALRDRNGNAIVVNRLAQLQQIFTEQDRVWIILNREKFRSRKKNIRWEYPGAREELFIRQNCDLKFRSYLWGVYLWDKNNGNYSTFRKESNNWVE